MNKHMRIALLCGVLAACTLLCSCGSFGGGREQIDNVLDKIFGTTEGTTTAPEEQTTTAEQQEIPAYDYFGNAMDAFVSLDKALYASFEINVGMDYVVTDEVVQDQLDSIRYQYATATNGTEQVTDQAIRFGDKAYIYYEGKIDDVAFSGGSNMSDSGPYGLGIGSGSFIPGFEEGLIGVVPAETSRDNPYPLHVTFPENYGSADLAGKDAIFYVVVEYVVQYDVPELTDAFVKDTLKYTPEGEVSADEGALAADYIAYVRKSMEDSALESARSYAFNQAMGELCDKVTFKALPEGEVQRNYDSYIAQFEYYYSYYSYMYGYQSLDEFAIDYMGLEKGADWKAELTETCELMVKDSILLHAIAEAEGIEEITDEEFKAELDYLVEYYGGQYSAEYIRENMGDDAIKDNALYTKVMDFILDRTTIKYE